MTSACTWALAFSSSKSHKAEGHSDAFPQELMLASMPRGKDAQSPSPLYQNSWGGLSPDIPTTSWGDEWMR